MTNHADAVQPLPVDTSLPVSATGMPRESLDLNAAPFVSWAQNFEDVMLWRALKDVESGFYIDVGACEPKAESVTWAFYSRGWHGINVEPVEANWRRLRDGRPRDINIHAALGRKDEQRILYLVDGGCGLSTLREDIARQHAAKGHDIATTPCRVSTLAQICRDHVDGPIHFLKVDVEGAEREVLDGADFQRFRPWIVLVEVEAVRPNSPQPTRMDWEAILLGARYRFAYFDGLNRFYVAEEHWDRLGPALATPPNVFDGFVRVAEQGAEERATSAEQQAAAAEERAASAEQQAAAAEERSRAVAAQLAEQTARAERAIAERDAFEQEMYEVNRHAAWLGQQRQNLLWKLDEIGRTLEETHRTSLNAIYSSHSWRVTAPLRAVSRLLYRR